MSAGRVEKSFDLTDPALSFCIGDAGYEVVADVDQALMLVGINSKQGATNVPLTKALGRTDLRAIQERGFARQRIDAQVA